MAICTGNQPVLGYLEPSCPTGKFKRQTWQLLCRSYVEGDALWVLFLILSHAWQRFALISVMGCNKNRNQPLRGLGWNVTLPGAFWYEAVEGNQEGMQCLYPSFLPISSSLQHFLFSLVAPYKPPILKTLIVHLGMLQSLGVKGKFLRVILFSEDCRMCLDFKSGLVFQDTIWKYRTDWSTCCRKQAPLTWDLTIWDAVLGKGLIWVRFWESSLEPLRSEVNFNHRLNITHLATSSETDTAFLSRTALSSGLLLGEWLREGKDWAGLSLSAFSMFSVCWH